MGGLPRRFAIEQNMDILCVNDRPLREFQLFTYVYFIICKKTYSIPPLIFWAKVETRLFVNWCLLAWR